MSLAPQQGRLLGVRGWFPPVEHSDGQSQRHPQPDNGNLGAQLYTNKIALVPFS